MIREKRNLAKAQIIQNNNSMVASDKVDLKTNIEKKAAQSESLFCTHSPQCLSSLPRPTQTGPPTQAQYELQTSDAKNEAMLLEMEWF